MSFDENILIKRMTDGNYLDHLILKALRKDDEKALSHLFESQYNRLFRIGLKLGADTEVVKESIQAIFKDLWQYRHSLADIQSFEAYLKRHSNAVFLKK